MNNIKEKLQQIVAKITFKRGVFLIVFGLAFAFSLGFVVSDYQQKGTIDIDTVIKVFDALIGWVVRMIIFI